MKFSIDVFGDPDGECGEGLTQPLPKKKCESASAVSASRTRGGAGWSTSASKLISFKFFMSRASQFWSSSSPQKSQDLLS